MNKQNSSGHILNSAMISGQDKLAKGKQRHNPTLCSLTPDLTKPSKRVLKKSSSVCAKMIVHSEDRKLQKIDSDLKPNQSKITRSASRTPVSRIRNIGCNPTTKSPDYPKNQKVTPVKGKKKRGEIGGKDEVSSRPKKKLAICSGLELNDYNSAMETVDGRKLEERKTPNKKLKRPLTEIKSYAVSDTPTCNKSQPAITSCPSQSKDSQIVVENNLDRIYGHIEHPASRLKNNKSSGDFSVQVAVRVRPFNQREKENPDVNCVVEMYESTTCVTENNGNTHRFTYDISFWSFDDRDPTYSDQEMVYQACGRPLLDGAFQGYNTCLFAYGQTGSGKSYSMMGYQEVDAGIIPRFCDEMFQKFDGTANMSFTVEISYFEIYNEKIRDLLSYSQENRKQLKVREHPEHGPYVQDLSTFTVRCYKDIEEWLAVGNKNRATAATGMNDKSSRSHSVFTISLKQNQAEYFENAETQLSRTSKVNLIDLAGSEKANQVLSDEITGNQEVTNSRLKEGSCINKSLHTLGKVISILSEQQTGNKKKLFIPYRESILTWLLKESLGGNSRTSMIATISPANIHFAETLSTLRYASQARNIVNQVRVNEDPNSKIIRELLQEIEILKSGKNCSSFDGDKTEVQILRNKLEETKAHFTETARIWKEKLDLSETKRKEETEKLKKAGVAFKVDNTLPNLVNLNEDPMLSEVLVYVLNEGKTTFGNALSEENHDIKLKGPLVADNHCYINYELKQVRITAMGDAPTFVNGEQVVANTLLRHGDRIVIGGIHFFRFNFPILNRSSKREGRKKWDGLTLRDFEYAKKELTTQQNAKLEAELEDSQVKAQEGLIDLLTNAKETAEKQMNLQKERYKEEITALQKLLEETECRKQLAEKNQHQAENEIIQLKSHKQALEDEIWTNRRRLQEEATAAQQVFEDTRTSQLQIISELETEKQRIQEDLHKLKSKKAQREVVRNEIRTALTSYNKQASSSERDLLKIALLLREANKISQKLGRSITFSRDDILEDDKVEIRIRLNDTKFGKTTLWSLEKFEYMVTKMRDLYQSNGILEDENDDPFCDPNDEWEEDFVLDSPTTPGPGCSRMSVSRKYSLNHSLQVLTNLNASLSEMSTRRRSSFIRPNSRSTIASMNSRNTSLALLRDVFEFNTATEEAPICIRLVTIVLDVHCELSCLQSDEKTHTTHLKPVWKIAVLLQRLREILSTWSTLNNLDSKPSVRRVFDESKISLSKLSSRFQLIIKACEEDDKQSHHATDFLEILQKFLTQIGKLSLCAIDCLADKDQIISCSYKHPALFSSFMEGQKLYWEETFLCWIESIGSLIDEIRNKMQLKDYANEKSSLDHIFKLISHSSTIIERMKILMSCLFSEFQEHKNHIITEKVFYRQRCILDDLDRFMTSLEGLPTKCTPEKPGNRYFTTLKDVYQEMSIIVTDIVHHFGTLVDLTTENLYHSWDTSDNSSDATASLRRLEIATTSFCNEAAIVIKNSEKTFLSNGPAL